MRSLDDWYGVVAAAMGASSVPNDSIGAIAEGETLEDSFDNLGFDSLALMEFCIAIQVETGIEITISAAQELGSPRAVARHLSGEA
jgi:acyl carrier protein